LGERMSAVARAAGPAGRRAARRPRCARLHRGSAVDPGTGYGSDRSALPGPVHPARSLDVVAPHGIQPTDARTPPGRTRRGGNRHLAAGGVGTGKKLAAERGAWICFEDEAGHTLRPPRARTWAPRGNTPVIPVSGKGSGRISVAGLCCLRAGQRPHLLYRTKIHRSRKGERRSFAETDYAALLDAAHQRFKAPVVLIWDNLNTHISAAMRRLIGSRDWLHVIQLP